MAYILAPYRQWGILFLLQLGLTYFLNYHHSLAYGLISSLSESITSIVAAILFRLVHKKELVSIRSLSILLILLSATIGSLTGGMFAYYAFGSFLPKIYHLMLWENWTFSSLVGIVLMTPIIVEWRSINTLEIFGSLRKSIPELLLLLILTFVVTHLIFYNKLVDINLSINFPYLILPFIFWAAIRFHPRILSLLLFIVSLLILHYTNLGILPFKLAGQPFQWIVNSTQVFILFTIVFSYIMAGIILTRNEAGEKIKKLNEKLEERVIERTEVLQLTLDALKQSEEQFREAFETSIHGMALISLDGKFLRVNQAFCDMIGYSIADLLQLNLRKITHRDDYLSEMKKWKDLIKGEISYYLIEKRLIHKENLEFWVLESNSLIKIATGEPLHVVSQIVDITERKQTEVQLLKYTETLTVLLREVNHRVKNNLSALIGMLHMEENRASASGNTGYIRVLRDLISRIRGLATVHSMLSASNWQPLEISQLFEQIIQAALCGLPLNQKVTLKIDKSPIKINSNQAHHLTLVINELATNSVKYGLKENTNGIIEVRIQEINGKIYLVFRDNGSGYPESMINGDFSNVSIGFELIRGIVTQSLDGQIVLRNQDGAITEILFANELN
jgi:PAS domain S-box-containing protein